MDVKIEFLVSKTDFVFRILFWSDFWLYFWPSWCFFGASSTCSCCYPWLLCLHRIPIWRSLCTRYCQFSLFLSFLICRQPQFTLLMGSQLRQPSICYPLSLCSPYFDRLRYWGAIACHLSHRNCYSRSSVLCFIDQRHGLSYAYA